MPRRTTQYFYSLFQDFLLNRVIGSILVPVQLRWRLLRVAGMPLAPSRISPHCWFGGTAITIGHDTFVNRECYFDNSGPISIGARCNVGMQVLFTTSHHHDGTARRRAGATLGTPITVGDGCWLGARVIVLPGVTIGSGCIVGAGSLVTTDCEPHGLYLGSPARRIRDLPAALDADPLIPRSM
jgi:maltose O-acetyltransferase